MLDNVWQMADKHQIMTEIPLLCQTEQPWWVHCVLTTSSTTLPPSLPPSLTSSPLPLLTGSSASFTDICLINQMDVCRPYMYDKCKIQHDGV